MAKKETGKTAVQSRKQKQYELSAIDLRFLKAMDIVIEKHRKGNIKPDSDNSISKTVFGDRNIVGKVRASQRGVSMAHLEKFAIYFGLDFNCFFRDTETIEYDPQDMGGKVAARSKGIASTGENAIITQVEGDHNGDVFGKVKGDVYKGSKIGQIIQKAEKIINNKMDNDSKEMLENILNSIRDESGNLESIIIQKNEEIKKMQKLFTEQLGAEKEKRADVERDRDEAREEERKIMKKYLALLEKKG
ncbi:MAG: hypothetical protein OEW75_14000 [Cyclobacteriaceae bacterium]|nr:hypothetical protein [Cyclobacteriaceae bacterium]